MTRPSSRLRASAACLLTVVAATTLSAPLAQGSVPDTPEAPCAEGTFTAEYFDNTDLTGRPFLVECHERIHFDWGQGRAHPRVPEDHFGVRWSADIPFDEGTYRFQASTDDGTRVYLDGELIIDAWYPRPVRTTVAYGHVPSGRHTLVVEYFEQAGYAVADVSWDRSATGWFQAPLVE